MVHLVPMTDQEFRNYVDRAIPDYANEHVRSGNWHPTEALERAQQEFTSLLPDGVTTAGQYLYTVHDADLGQKVGMIWLAVMEGGPVGRGFIYDFEIDETLQRRGYGAQTLTALEERASDLGVQVIGLHVFAHNQTARRLYERAGYEVTDLWMAKKLGSDSERSEQKLADQS